MKQMLLLNLPVGRSLLQLLVSIDSQGVMFYHLRTGITLNYWYYAHAFSKDYDM